MTASFAAVTREFTSRIPLIAGWELSTEHGDFIPARVPGTVASALREQAAWRFGCGVRFDPGKHTFRCRFECEPARPGEEIVLEIGGIATIAEVWLNQQQILRSSSMFEPHQVLVTHAIRERNELSIVCHSLSEALLHKKAQAPQARWRTRVVADQPLRWFRTTLLGRAPGFAPEPEPVGPWRPIALLRRSVALDHAVIHAALDGSSGVVRFECRFRPLDQRVEPVAGRLIVGGEAVPLEFRETHISATLRLANVRRWWPHSHGDPSLYPARVELDLPDGSTAVLDQPAVGFRNIRFSNGFELNRQRIFTRGVVWTPPDPVSLAAPETVVRERLERLRDAGFNLIRLAGTMVYEDETFHRLCDQLGMLVWQDLMFANMDYPFEDAAFHETVCAEAQRELTRVASHASSALICGNSEIEQQATMLGLDPGVARAPFFAEELPRMVEEFCPGVPYVPSAPSGGDLPFRPRTGVANYFGVGAYLRPLEDVRRAEVRFASECLAFSNVPEPEVIEKMTLDNRGGISPTHPAWKRAAPRDAGTGWDFEDVRDHYLKLLYGVDPAALRYSDTPRYWELSRTTSAEVMAEVFGEWRRAASPNRGAIILWAADLEPGAGWGILDSRGWPKAAYWSLRRALASRAVWTTDEGLNGVDIHVANDRASAMDAWLRVALYRNGEQRVAEAGRPIHVPGNDAMTLGVEEILGRFVDAAWAYRFGPPGHDVIAVGLHASQSDPPFAQCFRFPAGRPTGRRPIAELGISARAAAVDDATVEVTLSASRFVWAARAVAPGWLADDCYFGIEPGVAWRVVFRRLPDAAAPVTNITLSSFNAEGRIRIPIGRAE